MKDIAIYGYGGFGHEVACLIQHINKIQPTWNIVGYFDDGVANGSCCKYGKVLGDIHTLNAWNQPLSVVIAIGTVKYLEEIPNKITNPSLIWLTRTASFSIKNLSSWGKEILLLSDAV